MSRRGPTDAKHVIPGGRRVWVAKMPYGVPTEHAVVYERTHVIGREMAVLSDEWQFKYKVQGMWMLESSGKAEAGKINSNMSWASPGAVCRRCARSLAASMYLVARIQRQVLLGTDYAVRLVDCCWKRRWNQASA